MGINRQKVLEPRRTLFWCEHCDRARVAPGGRCPVCRQRASKRRLRK